MVLEGNQAFSPAVKDWWGREVAGLPLSVDVFVAVSLLTEVICSAHEGTCC